MQKKPVSFFFHALVSVLIFLGTRATTSAQIVTYYGIDPGADSTSPRPNSLAAAAMFDAAAALFATTNLIDFENAPVGPFGAGGPSSDLTVAPGVVLSGLGFETMPQQIRAGSLLPDHDSGFNTTLGGTRFVSTSSGGFLTLTFATPISAFGAFFSGLNTDHGQDRINFNDGSAQTFLFPANTGGGVAFFGFTDAAHPFSSITINITTLDFSDGDTIGLDDVRYGAALIPEPSTWLLLALGVFFAPLILRRPRPSL